MSALVLAQLDALKAAILADPNLTALVSARNVQLIVDYMSGDSSRVVWRTSVNPEEIMTNGMDWTQIDNLSIGKARIWEWMTQGGRFNPAKPNIRAGIIECWKGTAAMLAVQASVFTHCKRFASRFEAVFATGTGTTAAPATLDIEGTPSLQDIAEALYNPDGSMR